MAVRTHDTIYKELIGDIRFNLGFGDDGQDDSVYEAIDQALKSKTSVMHISAKDQVLLRQRIFNALRRLDILQPLIEDENITEIMVNGPDEIFIEEAGRIRKLSFAFESLEQLENVIQKIVSKVNRTVNESNPICDARLEDGSRIHVVLPPVAMKGPTLTIRKFPSKPLTMERLIELGSIDSESADFLKKLVRSKYNIFISGGTGSGKTTFLNVLSNAIPEDERVITIEDSAELQIRHIENLVSLESRNSNSEGKGRIAIRDLIKASLRMRPDRIVVGEVRGEEALDMLQAMNTGHDGSLSTGHSNSSKDMLSRLETMVLTGHDIPLQAIRQQIASAVDVIVHLGRMRDKTRKVMTIDEVLSLSDQGIELNPLYRFEEDETSTFESVSGQLVPTGRSLISSEKLLRSGLDL